MHEIDMFPLLLELLRNKKTILASMLLSSALGLVSAMVWPATFTATTEILPPQQRPAGAAAMLSEVSAGASALASAGSDLQARSVAETYVHMLQAQPVLDGLIQHFSLKSVYHQRYVADTRKALMVRSSVAASKEGFITVAVQDRDRQRAADIANAYVEQLRELSRHLALSESSQRRVFYEMQLAKSKEDLSMAEVAFKLMQQSKGVISLDAQARTMIEGAAQLRAQIAAKEVELGRLRGFATANNPQVQSTEDELRALRGQLGRAAASSSGGYIGMGLGGVPAAELEFVRASRELRYQESVYELLMKQYELARMDEARDAPAVQVLQVATAAERPSWPKKAILVPAGNLFGLLLACGWIALRFWRGNLDQERSAKVREIQMALWGRG